jgi:predicted chitinase
MLATRAKLHVPPAPQTDAEAPKESGSFKQLKESLNRPATHAVSTALGNTFGPARTNLPLHGGNQIIHNQTQGGVNRINVPRRTAG